MEEGAKKDTIDKEKDIFIRGASSAVLMTIFFYRSECEAVGVDRLALSKRREVVTRLILPRLPSLARPTATVVEGTPPPKKQLVVHILSGDNQTTV